ncbi:hypothetical protein FSP39_022805 [Pinctada imbricata]|uniref:IgGFc-binding protein N-terminal domain-containing protein n=1 Tax=Pinctada imbricata TaxID=66713 RepID=A0AA88XQB6_PINIB|nr:hypothetical protein FSP39_022805 [Pinctada imbricata]
MTNLGGKLDDIPQKLLNVENNINDTIGKTEDLEVRMNRLYDYVHNETELMRTTNNFVCGVGTHLERTLNKLYDSMKEKMESMNEKLDDISRNMENMERKLNNTKLTTEFLDRKMIELHDFIHNQRETMSRDVEFLVRFIYDKADLNDFQRNNKTKMCSTSTDVDVNDHVEKLQTGIEWLKSLDGEEKLGCKNHTGNEYAVMFPQTHLETEYDLQVIITSREDAIVDILSPYPGVNQTVNVKSTEGLIVPIPSNFTSWFNDTYSKGILLKSNKQISVYGATQRESTYGEAFMAIPTRFLSNSYYAASYNYTLATTIALYDDTQLNKSYTGPIIKTELQKNLSSLKVHDSIPWDRTSIQLESNKAIGVLASARCFNQYGSRYDKHWQKSWKLPFSVKKKHCTQVLSYIPPKASLGNVFIIPQIKTANSSLLYIESDWRNKCLVSFRSGEVNKTANFTVNYQYESDPVLPYVMETSLPSVAVLFIGNSLSTRATSILIPSVRQYTNHYKFITPFKQSFNHSAIIMIENNHVNGLKLDGKHVENLYTESRTINVNETQYKVISMDITAGLHEVHHVENDVTFGLIALGFSANDAYGFPVGLYLGEENCKDQNSRKAENTNSNNAVVKVDIH